MAVGYKGIVMGESTNNHPRQYYGYNEQEGILLFCVASGDQILLSPGTEEYNDFLETIELLDLEAELGIWTSQEYELEVEKLIASWF